MKHRVSAARGNRNMECYGTGGIWEGIKKLQLERQCCAFGAVTWATTKRLRSKDREKRVYEWCGGLPNKKDPKPTYDIQDETRE